MALKVFHLVNPNVSLMIDQDFLASGSNIYLAEPFPYKVAQVIMASPVRLCSM